jgi:hypothetical protein
MRVSPCRSERGKKSTLDPKCRLKSLGELKYYVRPAEGGWEGLGLEFKSAEELVSWICSHLDVIEPDRPRTYRRWMLYCYLRNATPIFTWYIRATPDQIYRLKEPWKLVKLVSSGCEDKVFDVDEIYEREKVKTPKDAAKIVNMLCNHIKARIAVPCDRRSASYFPHWILYCNSR